MNLLFLKHLVKIYNPAAAFNNSTFDKKSNKRFPRITGEGNVVGKGKGRFEGGTQIPPTKVEIIRPE
ncbi:hypothetical protein D0S48_15595 [Psychrobacillus sp. AK 1817]|nr:hypothetical protein D0S48_15595 [Psychrobacillus sp. AK 1817]